LTVWTFEGLTKGEEVSYRILKKIAEDCKELLVAFGIATGFEEENVAEEESSFIKIFLSAIIILIIVFLIIFLKSNSSLLKKS
jgi:hypothetical protein